MKRPAGVCALVGFVLILSAAAHAKDLEMTARPIFGQQTIYEGGWVEILVRLTNNGSAPATGEVHVHSNYFTKGANNIAPYSVAPGASVTLRIPVHTPRSSDLELLVFDHAGERLHKHEINGSGHHRTILLNVARASPLRLHIDGLTVGSRHDPWPGSSTRTSVDVIKPMRDPKTGDPVLPHFAAGYSRIAVVLLRSDELANLQLRATTALAEWTLAGGTLAIVITRPEDLRNPTIVALVGGEVHEAPVAAETKAYVGLSRPGGGRRRSWSSSPLPRAASHGQQTELKGYQGGNLHPSHYGASASYGLGEVHLLAFDPHERPTVDDPWVHVRMVDLLRRANERYSGILFRSGDRARGVSEVRRLLDPNESSHWAIILTALLLCLYSVFAGPVSFSRARRKGQPLHALVVLPIASALTFGVVVVIGAAAKGCSGRARHLTFIEAGAGMKTGAARRWRAFFVPNATDLTIAATRVTSVLPIHSEGWRESLRGKLLIDDRGPRLTQVEVRPWETMLVREDGRASLGNGIALLKTGPTEVTVVNRTGRNLRGLLLWLPFGAGKSAFLAQLGNQERKASGQFKIVNAHSRRSSTRGLRYQSPDFLAIQEELEELSPTLRAAWSAVGSALDGRRNWFSDDVPVLLAQVDGGEGRSSDSGLRIDQDRVLVRVVGYGGAK